MNAIRESVFEDDFVAFLTALEKRIGGAAFVSWMQDLRLEARLGDDVTLSTSSEFKRVMIEQRFLVPMRDAWVESVGRTRRFNLVARRQDLTNSAARVTSLAPASPQNESQLAGAVKPVAKAPAARPGSSLAELASQIDDRATFDRFAVDESNRIAFAAARQVVTPGSPRDVVYIYGPSGVGKTHLLHAIGNGWRQSGAPGDCAYLTYNNLKYGCVDAVLANNVLALHRDLAAQGVVLIDDIHLLASSVRTQMEILHLINMSQSGGCRIAIAGEVAPAELVRRGLKDRLADRLAGGLCVSVQQGGEALRREVLRKRVADMSCAVTDDAIEFIARSFSKSMRETLGALAQLNLHYENAERVVDKDAAAAALRDRLIDSASRVLTLDNVIEAAAKAFGITVVDIVGRSQRQKFVRARHGVALIAREVLKESYPKIGAALGRDHTTIMSSYDRATALITRCGRFQTAIAAIKTDFGIA